MSEPFPSKSSPSFPRGMALLVAGALFMEILDATIITPAIPRIADSFGVTAVDVNVAISAYMLTVAVLIPASGWLAERFGVRRVFLTLSRCSRSPRWDQQPACRCPCSSAPVSCKASAAR